VCGVCALMPCARCSGKAGGGYLGAEEAWAGSSPSRRRSPLKRLQDGAGGGGGGLAEAQSPKPPRCDDNLIEMAVEGGGELSLLSRSITSFSQFLPLPPSVKGRDILTLNLHYNQLRKMEPLDALPSLTELKLSSNEITQIEGISKLSNLRVLDLSCNRLRAIGGLEGLTSLQRLVLAYNAIHSLEGLRAIDGPNYDLRALDLTDNRVNNIQEVRHLQGCVKLEDLKFREQHLCNPICSHPTYAAVVAASCGTSLRTLDGESLVVHLGRMGRDAARAGGGGVGGGRGGANGRGEQEAVDSMIANMLQEASSNQAGQAGAPGGRDGGLRAGLKIPVRQLQEIFPERARGSRSRAIDPGSRPPYAAGQPYMPHVRLVGELGETRVSQDENAIK
jgi:hypothetical protein